MKTLDECISYLSNRGIDCNIIDSQQQITFVHNDKEYKFIPKTFKWSSKGSHMSKWPWKKVNGKYYVKWYSSNGIEDFYKTYVSKDI